MSEPIFREIQDATRLTTEDLTEEELEILSKESVSAISVSTPEGHPTQLNIWWENEFTYVKPSYLPFVKEEDKKETKPWKLIGYISNRDVAVEYMNRIHNAKPE